MIVLFGVCWLRLLNIEMRCIIDDPVNVIFYLKEFIMQAFVNMYPYYKLTLIYLSELGYWLKLYMLMDV